MKKPERTFKKDDFLKLHVGLHLGKEGNKTEREVGEKQRIKSKHLEENTLETFNHQTQLVIDHTVALTNLFTLRFLETNCLDQQEPEGILSQKLISTADAFLLVVFMGAEF